MWLTEHLGDEHWCVHQKSLPRAVPWHLLGGMCRSSGTAAPPSPGIPPSASVLFTELETVSGTSGPKLGQVLTEKKSGRIAVLTANQQQASQTQIWMLIK